MFNFIRPFKNPFETLNNIYKKSKRQNKHEGIPSQQAYPKLRLGPYMVEYEGDHVKEFLIEHTSEYERLFDILPFIDDTIRFYESSDGEYGIQKPDESGSYPIKEYVGTDPLTTNIKDPGEIIHEFGHAVDFSLYDPPHMGPYSFQPMFGRLQAPFKSEIYKQRRIENHLLYDLDYSANHEEIFARIFREYFKGKVPPLFDQFDPSWFDKAITDVYNQNKDELDAYITDVINDYNQTQTLQTDFERGLENITDDTKGYHK